jgi:dolichol-phosphate mannosyltransferase
MDATKSGMSIRLSVVLPVYNEAEVIPETLRRVNAVCESLKVGFEIVVVNDGSSDRTWPILTSLTDRYPHLVAVDLSRNHGHQLALTAGLAEARGERVLIMDADLQDPPELLPDLMRALDEGADVAYAQRRSRPGDSRVKRFLCAVFYRGLALVAEEPVQLDSGDFRLLSRRVVDALSAMPERQRFLRGMISWLGFEQVPVHYDRDARHAGESKYPLRKLIRLSIDALISSGLRPLSFALLAGGLTGFVGVLLLGYALYSWLFVGKTPTGWTSLLIAIVLMGSLQLCMLGILGEYLGRVYIQTRGRPIFLKSRVVRGAEADANSASPDGSSS